MDIKELPKRRKELEDAIGAEVQRLIQEFEGDTEIKVKNIHLAISKVRTLNQESPKTIVAFTEVELDI